jgi:superfamily II DNA/RNA helicase
MPVSFADLGVDPALVAKLAERGITSAFPIQEAAIPDALAGRDVVAKAPTGSGKTIAFGVAAVERCINSKPKRPRCLILEPTRELAAQVRDELASMKQDGGRRVVAVYGGTRYGPTQQALAKGVDILVACPGRLEDLLEQGVVNLSEVDLIVIDEADRMADMGFLPVVRRLIEQTSAGRQVLLFSATMGKEIESLVKTYQKNPARHDVTGDEEAQGDVDHLFWAVSRDKRLDVCTDVVTQLGKAIVFCRTRRGADRVARQLNAAGLSSVAIHGDRSQNQRERALREFDRGNAVALVATDVAARGIHLEALPGVIHFDPPADATDYTHRSGRTGRAGLDGVVVSLVVEDMRRPVASLQRALGMPSGFDDPSVITAPDMPPVQTKKRAPSVSLEDHEPRKAPRRDQKPRRNAPTNRGHATRTHPPRSASSDGERSSGTPSGGATGTVKFFDAERGYGFVSRGGDKDLFVHATNLANGPTSQLEVGQSVSFEIGKGKRGAEARNVRVVSSTQRKNRKKSYR